MVDMMLTPLTEHDRIASVSTTGDAIIGAFKDKEGRDGFLLSNITDPADNTKAAVTVKFNDAKKVVVYKKGARSSVLSVKGKQPSNSAPERAGS